MDKKTHYYYIDLVRILAFVAVVTIHVATEIFERQGAVADSTWLIALILSYGSRFATPLFVMISGYLMLASEGIKKPKEFIWGRAKRVLIPLIFWNVAYYGVDIGLGYAPGTVVDFWGKFSSGGTFYHLYFLFLIFGLYLITPVLKKMIDKGANLNIVVTMLMGVSALYFYLASWLGWFKLDNAITLFILYIGYYLAGAWVPNWRIKRSWPMMVTIAICLLITIGGVIQTVTIWGISDRGLMIGHRLSIPVAVVSLLIFYLFLGVKNGWIDKLNLAGVKNIGNLSMGIYLMHPLFIQVLKYIQPFNSLFNFQPLWWMAIAIPLTLMLSMVAVVIGRKIPVVRLVV